MLKLTNSTLALPLSLTLKGYEISRPVSGSFKSKNAWCGRLALRPSCVVKASLSVSDPPSDTTLDNGAFSWILLLLLLYTAQ